MEDDVYFPIVMRYVETNPLKAKLVDRAQDWEWSSLGCAPVPKAKMPGPWPVDRPRNWHALVNQPMSETDSGRAVWQRFLDQGTGRMPGASIHAAPAGLTRATSTGTDK